MHMEVPQGIVLLPHQEEDVKWLLSRGNGLLAHEVGGGKTYPAIVAAKTAAGRGKILCVGPLTIMGQMRDAWEKCYPDIRVQSYHSPRSGAPYSALAREAVLRSPNTWDVLIGNYDLLPRIGGLLSTLPFASVITDEAHRLKGYRGQRARSGSQSKALFGFISKIPFRVALTGTPILNGPEDAFGVFRAVDTKIFGDILWQFEQDWFYDISRDRNYKILRLRPDKREEFEDRVNANMRRYTKRQLMQLYPGKIVFPDDPTLVYEVSLPESVRQVYSEMAANAVAEIEAGVLVERRHILGRMTALQMLASGAYSQTISTYGVADDGEPCVEEVRDVHILDMSHKFDAMDEIISQIEPGQPVVIWAHYRHEIAATVAHLAMKGHSVTEIHGGVTGNKREEALDSWRSGAARFLVCQPAAAGEGLNLQIAQHDIYLSRSHSLKDWEQAKGRIPRLGSGFSCCTHHVIVSKNTMDEKIHQSLKAKRALASSITRDEFLASLK